MLNARIVWPQMEGERLLPFLHFRDHEVPAILVLRENWGDEAITHMALSNVSSS
jgi:hypothetical protein